MFEKESELKKEVTSETKNERVEVERYVLEPVDREANKFHFLQNLTEWHQSIPERDNKIWEKRVGGFLSEEKKAVRDIKEVIERYPQWNKKGFVSIFTTSASPEERWERLKKSVKSDDLNIIKRSLSIIERPFYIIWKENEKKLLQSREEFTKKLDGFEKSGRKNQLEEDLSEFFGKPKMPDRLKIFFLMQEKGGGGSAHPWGEAITLSGFSHKLSVFYHELIHQIWEKNSRIYQKNIANAGKLIERKSLTDLKKIGFRRGGAGHSIINESITGSLLPHGCFQKFFPEAKYPTVEERRDALENLFVNKRDIITQNGEVIVTFGQVMANKDEARNFFKDFLAMNLTPLSERYMRDKREIDKAYFQEAIKIILSSIKRTKIFEHES